jgi:hypothetical protein
LFELLAVIGLMAAATAVAITCLRGGGSGTARDAAVALLASRVGQARSLAVSRGVPTRLFVNADAATPERFLRQLVVCVQDDGDWRPVDAGSLLPDGIVVLPPVALTTVGPGAVCRAMDDWSRPSGGALRSTALEDIPGGGSSAPVLGTTAWRYLHFSVTGGTRSGDLVVAIGWAHSAELPVTVLCEQPDNVAGFSISQYGVATFARGRRDF